MTSNLNTVPTAQTAKANLARPKTVPQGINSQPLRWPDYRQINRLREFGKGLLKNIYPEHSFRKACTDKPQMHFGNFYLTCFRYHAFNLYYKISDNESLLLYTDAEVPLYNYLKAFIRENGIESQMQDSASRIALDELLNTWEGVRI